MFDINVHWEMITVVKTVNISNASCSYLLSGNFKYTTWLNKDFLKIKEPRTKRHLRSDLTRALQHMTFVAVHL